MFPRGPCRRRRLALLASVVLAPREDSRARWVCVDAADVMDSGEGCMPAVGIVRFGRREMEEDDVAIRAMAALAMFVEPPAPRPSGRRGVFAPVPVDEAGPTRFAGELERRDGSWRSAIRLPSLIRSRTLRSSLLTWRSSCNEVSCVRLVLSSRGNPYQKCSLLTESHFLVL